MLEKTETIKTAIREFLDEKYCELPILAQRRIARETTKFFEKSIEEELTNFINMNVQEIKECR